MIKPQISYEDFNKVDIRVGKIVKVEDFPQARNPSYKLWIDFGSEIGTKTSSAQIVKNQAREELLNREVACVINFEPKQIGPFRSEVLVLGPNDGSTDPSNWIVLTPLKKAALGSPVR